jgi:hypothetical protein
MLHVTNGDAAVPVLREHGVQGAVLPWRDVLHEGPVRAGDHERLARERAAFLAAAGWGSAEELAAELLARDGVLLAAVAAREPVVLWFDDDLYDQLQVLQVLDLAGEDAALSLVELPRPPRLLGSDPASEPLGAEHVALARRAWAALRSGDVAALHALADVEGDALLPHLPLALERLLQELPWTVDGLSRLERAALRTIAAGERDRLGVFAAVGAQEERPFLGDSWLEARLDAMAALLAPDGGLSALGEDVLAGRADWLRDGEVDRWLGGLRLRSPGPTWRWDPEACAPVAP